MSFQTYEYIGDADEFDDPNFADRNWTSNREAAIASAISDAMIGLAAAFAGERILIVANDASHTSSPMNEPGPGMAISIIIQTVE